MFIRLALQNEDSTLARVNPPRILASGTAGESGMDDPSLADGSTALQNVARQVVRRLPTGGRS
jgi:hypothetical protein